MLYLTAAVGLMFFPLLAVAILNETSTSPIAVVNKFSRAYGFFVCLFVCLFSVFMVDNDIEIKL